jgi:hypothetical protein
LEEVLGLEGALDLEGGAPGIVDNIVASVLGGGGGGGGGNSGKNIESHIVTTLQFDLGIEFGIALYKSTVPI